MEKVILGLLMTICLLLGCITVSTLTLVYDSRPIVNCSQFSSRAEALKELAAHPSLDRNHNGIPCENLK